MRERSELQVTVRRARPRPLAVGVAVLRAVMVGAATILVPKADPAAHWSTPALTVAHGIADPGSDCCET